MLRNLGFYLHNFFSPLSLFLKRSTKALPESLRMLHYCALTTTKHKPGRSVSLSLYTSLFLFLSFSPISSLPTHPKHPLSPLSPHRAAAHGSLNLGLPMTPLPMVRTHMLHTHERGIQHDEVRGVCYTKWRVVQAPHLWRPHFLKKHVSSTKLQQFLVNKAVSKKQCKSCVN